MRILAITVSVMLLVLLAASCPRHESGTGGRGAAATSGQRTTGEGQRGAEGQGATQSEQGGAGTGEQGQTGQNAPALRPGVPQVALIFSATPGDAWSREIVQTAAGDLGFDAWSFPGEQEGIDTYGPYDVKFGDTEAQLHIAFSGLAVVATPDEWQVLSQRCKDWLDGFKPQVVWLDGDIAQLHLGNLIELDIPIVFTGVVLDADLYYSEYRPYTGVYKRHGMSAVLGKVWKDNPDAKHFALVSDDSPMSAAEVRRFVDIQTLLPEGEYFTVQPTVHSWGELRNVLSSLGKEIDALIVCGMGNQGASAELVEQDCPADILKGVRIPVVTMGPTRMDQTGALTVMIRPAAHARQALELVGKLLSGIRAEDLPVVTPDDMSVFQTVKGGGK